MSLFTDKSFFSKKFFLLITFLFLGYFSFSQIFPSDYVSRVLTTTDGLPGNTITDIIQSKDGYIYIGTYDGLVRYDGFDFTILNKNTVKDFNCVSARSVFEDSKGILWIGSNDGGLVKIKNEKVTMFTVKDGLPNNSIRAITEDKQGNIWIGTASGIVYYSEEKGFVVPNGLEEFDSEQDVAVSLYCDIAGRVWLNTAKPGGVFYYTAGKFHKYEGLDNFGDVLVNYIMQDSTGAFWFALGENGAIRIDDGIPEVFNASNGLTNNSISCIYMDKSNALWFGTEDGVILYKDYKWFYYNESQGLTSNSVKRIIEDREGNIWIATDRGGIEKMSMGKFRTINLPTAVNAITEDLEGLVWVGTDNGLLCYSKNQLVENELTEYCKDLRIRHTGIAKNGDILISCYSQKGQVRKTKDGIINWTSKEGLAGDKVRVCIEDKYGNLWVGTTTGLSLIYSDGKIKNYFRTDGLNNDYIMCLLEDSNGDIWVGTDGGGINIIRNEKIIKSYTSDVNGLAGNVIFKIFEYNNLFWISTGTGISRFDGNTFFNYDLSTGLGVDSVFQMLIDYTHTVWMTSNKGISTVSLDDMNKLANGEISSIDPKFFNQNDGLPSGGINSTSLSMIDSLGRLWFTLIDGYAVYDPVKVKSNRTLPLVHIEQIKIDDRVISPSEEVIIIPAGTKRIDIKYTGLSFISSEMVRFKYQLTGFEDDFSSSTSSRNVSYTNLAPGDYTFSVMASNSDGLWSESPATIKIHQQPFYYQTFAFWLLIALLIVFAFVIFVRIREKHMMEEQLRLETMVQMKTIDLEIEKDNSDRLLKNILPEPIAYRLKNSLNKTIADRFENVSVLFADIVNFTELADSVSAEEIVESLNVLFSLFDERAKNSGIEKIKTIGDAYMAVCGLPEPDSAYAVKIVNFAKGMYKDLQEYNKTAKHPMDIRIGINCGSVIAGVIGKSKFIYDLWGDTVNVASRMESLCPKGEILVTENIKLACKNQIDFEPVQEVEVKGKGLMKAYAVTK